MKEWIIIIYLQVNKVEDDADNNDNDNANDNDNDNDKNGTIRDQPEGRLASVSRHESKWLFAVNVRDGYQIVYLWIFVLLLKRNELIQEMFSNSISQ